MIPGAWSSDIQEFATQFQGIPNGVSLDTNSPEAAKEVPGAWYYTRHGCRSGPGGLVLHQGGWDRSDPCGGDWMATSGSIPTAARGVDTKGLRHQYQG